MSYTHTMSARSFRQPGRVLRGPDRVGIVGFHETAFVIARPTVAHAAWLQERTLKLHERLGPATNIAAGIRTATELLRQAPPSVLRRLWLLSDGQPNREVPQIQDAVEQARRAYININTIGFGDSFDEQLLRNISAGTHRGRFVPVRSLRQLVDVLVQSGGEPQHSRHRAENAVIAVDLSASMQEAMEGRTKIAVVEEAILQLLLYKQRLFS